MTLAAADLGVVEFPGPSDQSGMARLFVDRIGAPPVAGDTIDLCGAVVDGLPDVTAAALSRGMYDLRTG
jgi:hypothetical protein